MGSFNISLFFIVALAGRNHLYTFYPGRCLGLWKPLGFQPAFANIVGFPNLGNVMVSRLCKRCCFPNLVSSFLLIVIVIALRPGG